MSTKLSPGDFVAPPNQRRRLHEQAIAAAIRLIEADAWKEYHLPVVVEHSYIPAADLPRGVIVIESEYKIARASKKYLGVPQTDLPKRVYPGKADIIEFLPSTHQALIWEVKQSTIIATASREAGYYVTRFDESGATAGYHGSLGTSFPGVGLAPPGTAPPTVYDVKYADEPESETGAVSYRVRGREREPEPKRPPVWDLDPRLVALLLAAALATAYGPGRRPGTGSGPVRVPGYLPLPPGLSLPGMYLRP